ncbi:DUF2946 family protein, partial [Vibrio eleionomae]
MLTSKQIHKHQNRWVWLPICAILLLYIAPVVSMVTTLSSAHQCAEYQQQKAIHLTVSKTSMTMQTDHHQGWCHYCDLQSTLHAAFFHYPTIKYSAPIVRVSSLATVHSLPAQAPQYRYRS